VTEPLVDAIGRFDGVRVMVVGDVMLDQQIVGSSERLSPEAPVPVLEVVEETESLGGAGNVARSVVALGATAHLVGLVGDDPAGRSVLRHCADAAVDADGVVVVAGRPTTRKLRLFSQRQHVARIDWEEVGPLDDDVEARLTRSVLDPGRADVLVLSDYGKGVLSPRVVRAAIDGAHAAGVPVLVDPKAEDFRRYRGADLIKANQVEFERAVGHPVDPTDVQLIGESGRRLLAAAACTTLVVTLGSAGMVVVTSDEVVAVPTHRLDVYDVAGAGDTVVSILAVALATGVAPIEAARLACLGASVVISRRGVAVADADDLARAAVGQDRALDRAELDLRLRAWRSAGRRIVFTNGCFDLLHAGHVHLLQHAGAFGDVLVVGVDSDRSVASLKGEGRPIIPEHDRIAQVLSIAGVDAAVRFDHDELLDLIAQIRPDVLVKGDEYRAATVVGREVVEAAGGRVELVGMLRDRSTTALLAEIRGRAPDGPSGWPSGG
jgi:D-beta-D-heptose 7-phosphate kinase/D-beta-D-heptose 1-phosphate adenosyltransferase